MCKKELIKKIDRLHTTELGKERIKRNLCINTDDVVKYCKQEICKSECKIIRKGKNYYATVNNIEITINANSYTIITAHIKNLLSYMARVWAGATARSTARSSCKCLSIRARAIMERVAQENTIKWFFVFCNYHSNTSVYKKV